MISNTIKFGVFLSCLIPSIISTLFALFHICKDQSLRKALHNHVIIILLCISFFCQVTNYPWMLYFYRTTDIWERPFSFCVASVFIDWSLYVTQTILFAWATVERHILIFHGHLLATKRARLILHYLPIAILVIYCSIYYTNVIIFPPCENIWDTASLPCMIVCFVSIPSLFLYEVFAHQIAPVLIIVMSSILLILRIVRQKQRLQQRMNWRKYRKMTIQLISISSLYVLFSLPLAVVFFIRVYYEPTILLADAFDAANFLSYFPLLFLPSIFSISLPEMRAKMRKLICLWAIFLNWYSHFSIACQAS